MSLAQALADAGKEAGMRQLAGIMIKNALDAQVHALPFSSSHECHPNTFFQCFDRMTACMRKR